MNTSRFPAPRPTGFTLIELMVSMVAGLIVVGSVLAFTMTSLRNNADYVQATRLTQELRSSADFVSRELRRAGYDENAIAFYSQPASVVAPASSPFSALLLSDPAPSPDACVIYAYDRAAPSGPGVVDLAAGEIRGIRRRARTVNGQQIGVLEVAESSGTTTPSCTDSSPNYSTYPASCTGAWCPLTDPRIIDITSFVIDPADSIEQAAVPKGTPLFIRDLLVTIQGRLVGQSDVARGVTTRIKVRADCLRAKANCDLAPAGI